MGGGYEEEKIPRGGNENLTDGPSVESLTSHFTAPRPAPVPAQTARGLGKQILCVMFSDLP